MNSFASPVAMVLLRLAVICGIILTSCKKNDPARQPLRNTTVVIDSIVPKTGPVGTEVTIYGRNLGNSSTIISVNNKVAANKTVSETKFVVVIADSTGTGPVVVKNTLGQTTGPVFTYILTTGYSVKTYAGNSSPGTTDNTTLLQARFNAPTDIAIDPSGNLYVSDTKNHKIRKITVATGLVSTFAGTGNSGIDFNLPATSTRFNNPAGLAIDEGGNVFVADSGNNRIRRITSGGNVSTHFGIGLPIIDNPASSVALNSPVGLSLDQQGHFYISEDGRNPIRRILNLTRTLIIGVISAGNDDGDVSFARFRQPKNVVADTRGANIYITDFGNNKIRKMEVTTQRVSTFAGDGVATFKDGIGRSASFSGPMGITTEPSGNLFVTDYNNNRIRFIRITDSTVTTIAGNSVSDLVDGNDEKASFKNPSGIVRDAQGNFYVVDRGNNCIRKLTPYTH